MGSVAQRDALAGTVGAPGNADVPRRRHPGLAERLRVGAPVGPVVRGRQPARPALLEAVLVAGARAALGPRLAPLCGACRPGPREILAGRMADDVGTEAETDDNGGDAQRDRDPLEGHPPNP